MPQNATKIFIIVQSLIFFTYAITTILEAYWI